MHNNFQKFYLTVGLQHFVLGTLVASYYLYASASGISFTQLAFVGLFSSILSFFVEPLTSFLADFYDKKLVLMAGYLFLSLSFISLFVSNSLSGFIFSQVFSTLGLAFLSGTEEAFLHDFETAQTDNDFSKKLSMMQIYDESGTILGMISIGALAGILGFQKSYILPFFVLIIATCLYFFIQGKTHVRFDKDSKKPSWTEYLKTSFTQFSLPKISGSKLVLASTSLLLVYILINFRGDETWQISMKNYNISVFWIGLYLAISKGFSLLSSFLVYRFGHIISPKNAILLGSICIFLCYVLFLIPSQITPLFALIFYYFGENLVRPFLKSLILTNSPQNLKTTVLSLISGFSTLFKFPFVYLLSYLIDFNFTYGIMFMVGLKLLVFLVGGGYILRSNLVESLEINT